MDSLIQKSNLLISRVRFPLLRNLPAGINWEWRLNGITGARGVGKTTRMLQQAKLWQQAGHQVLYATLDDFYFAAHRPYEVAEAFYKTGGQYLLLDEVHKYTGWSNELKNIYDLLPDLRVTFSGSSVLQLHGQDADLSRRALFYTMPALSYREYLALHASLQLPAFSLQQLVSGHGQIAMDLLATMRPLQHWASYLRAGYYPFFTEPQRDYMLTLEQMLKYVLEVDFQYIEGYQPGYSQKLQAILRIIAQAPPLKPNISKMAEQVGINRNTMVNYLHYLHKASLTQNIFYPGQTISHLQKPDKVLLSNPNMYYAIAGHEPDKGSLRESAFVSMLSPLYLVHLHTAADFEAGGYVFEIGGRRKGLAQIAATGNGYVVKDDIETGMGSIIPLWMFGLLY